MTVKRLCRLFSHRNQRYRSSRTRFSQRRGRKRRGGSIDTEITASLQDELNLYRKLNIKVFRRPVELVYMDPFCFSYVILPRVLELMMLHSASRQPLQYASHNRQVIEMRYSSQTVLRFKKRLMTSKRL